MTPLMSRDEKYNIFNAPHAHFGAFIMIVVVVPFMVFLLKQFSGFSFLSFGYALLRNKPQNVEKWRNKKNKEGDVVVVAAVVLYFHLFLISIIFYNRVFLYLIMKPNIQESI